MTEHKFESPSPMPKPSAPYLTREPWLPFTRNEKPRPCPLRTCPSAKCRRAKACVDAHEALYCQHSHESLAQYRARTGWKPPSIRARSYTEEELDLLHTETQERLAHIADIKREKIAQWKAGMFDALYGKYRAHGVWKHPPKRQYTE